MMPFEVPTSTVADKPKTVMVCVTDVCNLTCVQCPHVKPGEKWTHNQVPAEKIREASSGATGLSLHGAGEVLMHPRWTSYVPEPSPARAVYFVTNGTLFTQRNVDLLIKFKIHSLDISLDAGSAAVYKKIRGGNWDKVWEGIDRLIAARQDEHPILKANMTLMQANVWEVHKLIPLLASRRFARLGIFHLNKLADAAAQAWRYDFNDGSGTFSYHDQQCTLPENQVEHDDALREAARVSRALSFNLRCTGLFFGQMVCDQLLHELVPG